MHVLALLPPPQLAHLRSVLGAEHRLTVFQSSVELTEFARRTFADVAVVDPGTPSLVTVEQLTSLMAALPSLPIVPYTSLTSVGMKAIADLAPYGISQVVLYRVDDAPPRFLDVLRTRSGDPLTAAVVGRLELALERLSGSVVVGVRKLFEQPHRFFSVYDLARAAGVTPRTLYRQFEIGGLATPRLVVLGARLLRAYVFLRDPAHMATDVVTKLGFSSRQQFGRVLSEVTGFTPRVVQRRPDDALFVDRLIAVLVPPPGAPRDAEPWPDEG